MAQNPDPLIEVTSINGRTRPLDDWLTTSHLCLVAVPARPEAAPYVRVARRVLDVFRDADCKTAFLVTANALQARRILGDGTEKYVVFLDPDRALVKNLGLSSLPAFVHLRADTTLVDAAEGWDPPAWHRVSEGLGREMAWSHAVCPLPGDPPPFAGWAVS